MARELEVAVAAAEAAGEVLRNGFGRQHRMEHKGEADLAADGDGIAGSVFGRIF